MLRITTCILLGLIIATNVGILSGAPWACYKTTEKAHFSRCGLRDETQTGRRRQKRIIGGSKALPNSWPWLVNFIDEENLQQCAGTIIDRQWILTAAHCFLDEKKTKPQWNYTYHVADHRLNITDLGEYTIELSQVFFHPKYFIGDSEQPGDYDIALIKLTKPLTYSKLVRPVCLPEEDSHFSKDDTCYVVGWGNTIDNSSYHRSSYLKEVRVDLVSLDQCNNNVSYNGVVPTRFFCAGLEKGGVDGCYGDSGGPLQCERNGIWTQLGIMIWGKGCAQPNHYGVYSDIRVLLPFIRAVQKGPNIFLASYYQKTLEETKFRDTQRELINLHNLLTKDSHFSDIDLVRNLLLVPKQIELLKKANLLDLVFVSNNQNLLGNVTTLTYIIQVFLQQTDRLNVYDESKKVARELNITINDVVQLSNLSKDGLLNSNSDVLDKAKKSFYNKDHYINDKKELLSSNGDITLGINNSAIKMDLNKLPLVEAKKQLGDPDTLKIGKISSVSNSVDRSLYEVIKSTLHGPTSEKTEGTVSQRLLRKFK